MGGQIMHFYLGDERIKSVSSEEYGQKHPDWDGKLETGDTVEIDGENMIIDSVQPDFSGKGEERYIINVYVRRT